MRKQRIIESQRIAGNLHSLLAIAIGQWANSQFPSKVALKFWVSEPDDDICKAFPS